MLKKYSSRPIIILVLLSFYMNVLPSYSEGWNREEMQRQLGQLEKSVPSIDKKTRKVLGDLGFSSRQQFVELESNLLEDLKNWDEDLELEAAGDFDVEARRAKLRENIRLWTNAPGGWELHELKEGIADALVIASADGLNVDKLKQIYELTKQVIRTADFVPPNSNNLGKLDALNLTTSDRLSTKLYDTFMTLWGLGRTVVASEARAREDHLRFRMGLYKRAVIAYIRALISTPKKVSLCRKFKIADEIKTKTGKLKLLACPDPTIENFKAYAGAVQKIQSADTEMFKSEVALLIAEQQFVSDIMSAAPLLGESLDLYGILFGHDIAGQCLSTEEKVLASVFLSLPYIGKAAPWVIKQIEKRSPRAAEMFATFRLIFDIISNESGTALTHAYREMRVDLTERLAKRFEVPRKKIEDAIAYFKGSRLPEMDAAAKGRMTTFRTVRNAVESRHWRDQLPAKALKEARARSAKIVKENLGSYQMARKARIAASNIVDYHIPVIERVARDRNEVIVIRYVNEASTELLAGGAGTKHMGIKGKSANRGPIQALLPVNQSLNKQGSRLEDLRIAEAKRTLDQSERDEIIALMKGMESGEASMKKCLKDPKCAAAIELPIKHPTREGDAILQVARDRSKKRHVYFIQEPDGRQIHYKTGEPIEIDFDPTHPQEAVKVLADPVTGAPLTADYDFLGLGVEGSHGIPRFDPDTGYVTSQMNETLEAVNEGIFQTQRARGLDPQKMSHHGAERWYPFSPGALDVDPFVTAFDPDAGLIRIPRCDYDCMRSWCKHTGQCNPAAICPPKVFSNCIPPDHDRLLKDYYHDKRLANYDLSPNSVWSWGHYNPGGGWTFSSYAESYRQKQIKTRLARESGAILTAPGAKFASFKDGRMSLPNPKSTFEWARAAANNQTISNIASLAGKQGLPKCTERAS